MKRRARRAITVVLICVTLGVAAVTIGPYVYIHFIQSDPPARLDLDSRARANGSQSTDTNGDGAWSVTQGSQAGYRAKEILFGQESEAVGRTSDVTGGFEISGGRVTMASITVDMTTIESDESRRDDQFRGRIMDTATYPTATFVLSKPIELGTIPAEGDQLTVKAVGILTLRGVPQTVSVDLQTRRNGDNVEVAGNIPVNFDDYKIPDASGGPASVGRNGEVELLLVFQRAA
jgi:polyisoprenoid-binding protein YceI